MVVSACPPPWRRAARFTLLVPGVAIAVLVPSAVPSSAAEGSGAPPPPAAQALDGDKPLASTKEVTSQCETASACRFRLYDRAPREFTSGVVSVGNAAINCTNGDMDVNRTVTLVSTSTDNIGGEISGSASLQGGIDVTVTVSGQASVAPTMTNGITQWGPSKDKGPTTQDQTTNAAGVTATVTGSNALHLGVSATFQSAFKAAFSRQWQAQATETTKVSFSVSPGDEIQFGMVSAMSRAAGELTVNNTGKLIKNVTVDSPSVVTASSIVAQTFSVPDKCLSLRPPGRAGAGLIELPPVEADRVPDAVFVRTAEGTWRPR